MPRAVTHSCNKEAEIASIQTTLDLLQPNMEKLMSANMSSIRAMIQANHDIEMLEFKEVKDRQDKTNGRVQQLEVVQRGYDAALGKVIHNQKIIRWAKKNPIKAIGVVLLINFILLYAAESVSIDTLISWIK